MTDRTQPEALDLADWLEAVGGGPSAKRCAALLREQHARIADLEAQLEAVGAGGVSPLIGQLFSIVLPAVFIPVVFASFYANALDVFGTITPDDAA